MTESGEVARISKEMKKSIKQIQKEFGEQGQIISFVEASRIYSKNKKPKIKQQPLKEIDLLDLFD